MDENPYKSSSIEVRPTGWASLVQRSVAILCWVVCLFLWLMLWTLLKNDRVIESIKFDPLLSGTIIGVAFVMPPIGFFLFGVAVWLRSWRLALLGAMAFLPLLLYVAVHAARGWPVSDDPVSGSMGDRSQRLG